jgi:hypothetical protein
LSLEFKASRVGVALDISDHDKFIKGSYGEMVYNIESGYYKEIIPHEKFEIYKAPTDTTFCLINRNHPYGIQIRIGGNFIAKHLPWYENYLKDNIPKDELKIWVINNKSSSILEHIDISKLLS